MTLFTKNHILHLHKMFRIGKSIEIESSLRVSLWIGIKGSVGGEWGVTLVEVNFVVVLGGKML